MIEFKMIIDKLVLYLPKIGLGLSVLLVFIFMSWVVRKIITKRIKPKTKNPLLADFLGKIAAFIITITGFVFFLNIIGLGRIATHIMAGAGITTFVIGFAFKDIGENFLSGILMAFKSPFRVGDLIETGGTMGYVSELNLRESILKTLDGKDVYIPNSQIIKSPLFNYTIDGFLRYEILIGIDYNVDIKNTIEIIQKVLLNFSEVLQGDKKPIVVAENFAASSVSLKAFYWIDTFKSKSKAYHLNLKSNIMIQILEQLNKNNIYLPSEIVELKNYNNQSLKTNN
ncbi:MAG: mechanosensitive ion channel [Salinivirgaceae bacterium]|jgi:small conductance mechanosensitive channel|nr:mechanosensitive ion channel [Salinivirgaceae bacterium]